MTTRGPLRKLAADIIATAPPALVVSALALALKQEGTYDSTDPARLLARMFEDAFAGYRPTVEQIERVTKAVESATEEANMSTQERQFIEAFRAHTDRKAAMAMVAPTPEPISGAEFLDQVRERGEIIDPSIFGSEDDP